MIALGLMVVVIVYVVAKRRQMRSSTLAANQAAQQVQSPYSAVYPRNGRPGLLGQIAERYLGGGRF